MEIHEVKYDQNIFDVAVQLYGSFGGMYMLFKLNPDLNYESVLALDQEIIYDPEFVVKAEVRDYLSDNQINVSTGESNIY